MLLFQLTVRERRAPFEEEVLVFEVPGGLVMGSPQMPPLEVGEEVLQVLYFLCPSALCGPSSRVDLTRGVTCPSWASPRPGGHGFRVLFMHSLWALCVTLVLQQKP